MTENEKIEKLIEKYRGYFENSNADVCHTVKGVWLFCEYDEEYNCFNSIIRFNTAEELKHLIHGLIADDLNCLIEVSSENVYHDLIDIDVSDTKESHYDDCIPKLVKNLEVLSKEYQEGAEKLNKICKSLTGILSEK